MCQVTPSPPYLRRLLPGCPRRAAYGYPLLGGYLSSMNSAVFMGTLKTIQFDVVGGASADAHNKALLLETHLKVQARSVGPARPVHCGRTCRHLKRRGLPLPH